MGTSANSPERLVSAALHARAEGSANPEFSLPVPPSRPKLPVLRVLLFALALGLLAGGVAGWISTL